jgi:transposase-like protein
MFKEVINEVLAEVKKRESLDKQLLTISQIAKKFQVTKTTIHNWRTRGLIVGHKVGKNRYYTEDEVNEALLRYGWESKLQDS